MATTFTEFKFFNGSAKAATAILTSGKAALPSTVTGVLSDVPGGRDDAVNPNQDSHGFARVAVWPEGKAKLEIQMKCQAGFYNKLHVRYDGTTLTPVNTTSCGT
jgi:hypothetical protein